MFTEQVILHIHVACIAFMLLTTVILIVATRLKNGAGYMALVTVSTTIPVYLSNLLRSMDSDLFEVANYVATTLNVMCFPFLWFFVRRQLDSTFRFTARQLLHLLPALLSLGIHLIYYIPLDSAQIAVERALINAGEENLPALINDTLLFGQFFVYFPWMFYLIYKRKRYILENYTDSNYVLLLWLPRFLWLFFVLFFVVFVVYVINPRTDTWLIPILNTLGMAYLTYCAVRYSSRSAMVATVIPLEIVEEPPLPTMDIEEMRAVCERAVEYAVTTRVYLNPDITLAAFAKAIGISQRTLSRSINGYRCCNFFEFINAMRVDEAKRCLLQLDASGYNIDSIYAECGFRSRSTFFMVFKKLSGKTPAAWLKEELKKG